jgi:hypothetical protein
MSLDQIFEAVVCIEQNPFKIWDLIEKHYKKNFFENVIIKRYASIFDNKDETDFVSLMNDIRTRVTLEVGNISK